uniref:DUF6320 domain-containing protein n=1 Tax=Acetatifactor sp. TaxID=1872090 RepID=UPI0040578669
MSYCVNCGVELHATAKACPLCNTPVYNPGEIKKEAQPTPYPTEKGQVEKVKRKDLGILLTTVIVATAVTCGLLNVLVFTANRWSLAVIGVCVILWVIMIPVVIYTKQSIYVSLFYDGIAVGVYLYLLTFMVDSEEWFWGLGLPIVVLVTILVEAFTFSVRKLPKSILTISLYFFTVLALLCTGIELLIDSYLGHEMALGWSAVVLVICVVIGIALITMLSLRRLRNAVRRRLHF